MTASTSELMHSDQFALMIVDEYRDQEKCKVNVIPYKTPETLSNDTTQHCEDDKKCLSNIIK